jgi:hypothetical protein
LGQVRIVLGIDIFDALDGTQGLRKIVMVNADVPLGLSGQTFLWLGAIRSRIDHLVVDQPRICSEIHKLTIIQVSR